MITRRFILGGLATTFGASLVKVRTEVLPEIVGDGEHDDAPGLNAWLRGERVRFRGGARAIADGQRFILADGHFGLGSQLDLDVDITALRNRFVTLPGFRGEYVLNCGRNGTGLISHCHIDATHTQPRLAAVCQYA